jgi:parallel beta-helix repeat protein
MVKVGSEIVKVRSITLVIILVLAMMTAVYLGLEVVPKSVGATITVDDSGGANYTTIQAAVNAAQSGDTVFVYSGIYNEDVLINKTLTLTGEDRDTVVINGTGTKTVVEITSHWTNITDFSITNSGGDWGYAGIKLYEADNCRILDNNIYSNGGDGIRFYSSSNNYITNNRIYSNDMDGIYFWEYSNENMINNNYISDNTVGINILSYFEVPSYNDIINNNITNNDGQGIYLISSTHNNILNNNISNNGEGVYSVLGSNNNQILENNMEGNGAGIWIDQSNHNTVVDNSIINNDDAFFLTQAGSNDISSNIVTSNTGYGFSLWMSGLNDITDNIISYNNYGFDLSDSPYNNIYGNMIIGNSIQARDANDNNLWNDTYPSGGNFWSDYDGSDNYSGINQNISGSDAIGDIPYVIDSDSHDYYPLMEPEGDFVFLRPGWNLISIPTIQQVSDLSSVLDSISGSYDSVQYYNAGDISDHWKHYYSSKPDQLNDLVCIDHTMGIWVHIIGTKKVIFDDFGIQPSSNQYIQLQSGWNMVGYPSLASYDRTIGLNNLTFGVHVDAILSWNAEGQRWEEMDESDHFKIGKGYYIHAKSKCEWEVPL